MRTCTRFETDGLLELESGMPLDAHFDDCEECLVQRLAYLQLSQCIAAIGAELLPPPEWRARVRQALEERTGPFPAPSPVEWDIGVDWGGGWLPSGGLAAIVKASVAPLVAVAMLALGVAVWLAGSPGEPSLIAEVVPRSTVRGVGAQPGDVLKLTGDTGGRAYADLRIYFENGSTQLVMSCATRPGEPASSTTFQTTTAAIPCRRIDDVIEVEYTTQRVGSYWPVFLASDRTLPEPTGDLAADIAAALDRGARVVREDGVSTHR